MVTYEGTSQVKETKISIFLRQYELFKMTPTETVKEMFTRFTQIVNNLDSLGKVFTNEEKVRKMLRSLPKGKWGPKVTAVEEAQNLSTLPLDDLLGKLITHEMVLNEEDGELPSNVKNLALKAKKEEVPYEDTESDDDEEDPFALITRGLARILKMKKQFSNRESSGPSKYKGKSSNYNKKTKILSCFECGDTDHLVKDCPQKKRNKYKKYDGKKKAMVAAWSDSDSSSESDSEDEQANLCLMADQDDNSRRHLDVVVRNLISSPIAVLSEFLQNMIVNEENYVLETNTLKEKLLKQEKSLSELSLEMKDLKASQSALDIKVKALESENSDLKHDLSSLKHCNDELENEKIKLTEKCRDQQTSLIQFTNSRANLDKMLGEQQTFLNKSGIGYNKNFPKKSTTTFVKARGNWRTPTCFFCCKKGHVKETCPYRRKDPYILRNTFPFLLKEQVKQVWVPKGTRPPNMVYPNYESKNVYWSSRKG